jgi:hypothetical protein
VLPVGLDVAGITVGVRPVVVVGREGIEGH